MAWDGGTWTWVQAGTSWPGELQVALDLQHWLLVRRQADGGPIWLWLERASRPDRWDELRRAVYSRARPDALPGALPRPAKP